MTAAARRKGYRFENDVCNMLRDHLGSVVDAPIRRVLDQYREGELGDIVIPPFVIECKRYQPKPEPPGEWWQQVWAATEKAEQDYGKLQPFYPVLIWKFDRIPIHTMVPLNLISPNYPKRFEYTAQLTWDNLMMVMREAL